MVVGQQAEGQEEVGGCCLHPSAQRRHSLAPNTAGTGAAGVRRGEGGAGFS